MGVGVGRTAIVLAGATLLSACVDKSEGPRELAGADAANGLRLVEATGCAACHIVPGVRWPQGKVGGSLVGFADRTLISGRTPNQPDALIDFLRDPAATQPGLAMPPTRLSEDNLKDVAAYLYTLDD
ncbi:MAG: c-type cytochrome [Alphaproteobacteria bacterium]|nr:c-type cytochrome [Alphaproteobacteria bacterium]MBU2379353.1 c-type cytochrome [Alphaproteobacteria bacterium]